MPSATPQSRKIRNRSAGWPCRLSFRTRRAEKRPRSIPMDQPGRRSQAILPRKTIWARCIATAPASSPAIPRRSDGFRMAAAQGYPPAWRKILGAMYASGWGVAHDDSEAVKLFRKSADEGDVTAENYLGWMYAKGRGVGQDLRRSNELDPAARPTSMTPRQRTTSARCTSTDGAPIKATRKRCDGINAAAEQGYGLAEYNLGKMYANCGWGVHEDKRAAERMVSEGGGARRKRDATDKPREAATGNPIAPARPREFRGLRHYFKLPSSASLISWLPALGLPLSSVGTIC